MLKETFLELIFRYSNNEDYNLACWDEIEKNYGQKNRYYHNLQHLQNMLNELEKVKSLVQNLDVLLFSVFYHDIIYNVNRNDNEEKSAEFFKKCVSETSFGFVELTTEQIIATKQHKKSSRADANLLLDLDLSILGKAPNEYLTYSAHIRKEYKIYPDFLYNKGRKKVLQAFLDSEAIFKTAYFFDLYERQARENMSLELKLLG